MHRVTETCIYLKNSVKRHSFSIAHISALIGVLHLGQILIVIGSRYRNTNIGTEKLFT